MRKTTLMLIPLAFIYMSCGDNSDNSTQTGTDSLAKTDTVQTAPVSTSGVTQDPSTDADGKLVYELVESMYAGIALMKDGTTKGKDVAFKELANKLVTEHTKLTKELETLSNKKNWKLPPGEPVADMQKRETMLKEDVDQFQKDWLQSLRERHETNIGKLENAKPSDADVKAAGEKGLPKIKELLSNIKTVQSKL